VAHDFKADRGVLAGFDRLEANSPGTVAEGGAGLNLRIGRNVLLFTEAEGRIASDYWETAVRGGLTIRW
jgi:outer membrane autotransporter protein